MRAIEDTVAGLVARTPFNEDCVISIVNVTNAVSKLKAHKNGQTLLRNRDNIPTARQGHP